MRYSLVLMLMEISCFCHSQTYVSVAPSLTNDIGRLSDKLNVAIEAGRQWDVFSLGVAIGKSNLSPMHGKDTTLYAELRPNLNIFQQGKFTNTFTPGIGYAFNAKQNLVLEFTSGIEYSFTEKIHFNMFFGQYYYSGIASNNTVNFVGFSAVVFFAPVQPGSIFRKKTEKE